MARGAAQQQNLLNTNAGTSFGNAQSSYKSAMAGFQNLYNQPGYSPADQAKLMSSTMAPIGAAGGSAIRSLFDTSARTRNNAGVTGGADAIARSRMQALGQAGNQVGTQIADAARSDKEKALQGEASLYAPSLSSASSLYGEANKAMAARPSVLDNLTQGVSLYRKLFPAGGASA